MVTGAAATSINPDLTSTVQWWATAEMEDPVIREAAELVAFDVLDPALRSRGGVRTSAAALAADPSFLDRITVLLTEEVNTVCFPSVQELASRLSALEDRVALLEASLRSGS